MPMELAVGTSLLLIALTSALALSAHLATGAIEWPLAFALTGSAIVGALAGSSMGRVPQERLRQAFAGLIVAIGAFLLAKNGPALV